MLFDKHIKPCCAYCQRGEPMEGDLVICVKKGVVSPGGSCRAFQYDPLKRVPPKPAAADFKKYKKEDFSL